MTLQRFWVAMALFHAAVLAVCAWRSRGWRTAERPRLPPRAWLRTLTREVVVLGVAVYAASVVASLLAATGVVRRIPLGHLSTRLMGQALFAEGALLFAWLGFVHRRAGRPARAALLGSLALLLLVVYVDAYRVEPRMLRVRRHVVAAAASGAPSVDLRVLHLTDIQTPTIGAHEERALRAGLAYRPDLIVLTGDYVQNAMGERTEDQAAADLRALMERVGFDAPLGVFAVNGDAGPPCRIVFAGTKVRCLVDEAARIELPQGGTLSVIGLSRGGGRERDPARLRALLAAGEPADHRIVISHAPDFVDALPGPVDLVLAGHTHGGQVVLPLLGPPVTAMRLPRVYAGGLHDYEGTPLHVSRGVGMERGFAPPVRFLCPPEICVLDVRLAAP
jgi:predicted MPP superfamily phosphohydrolase